MVYLKTNLRITLIRDEPSVFRDGENPRGDRQGVIAVFRNITGASGLRNALEAFERIKGLNLELEARNRILQDLTSSIELDEVLVDILETSKKLIDSQWLSLLRLDEGSEKLYFAGVNNETFSRERLLGKVIPVDKGIAGWVAKNKKAIISNNPGMDTRFNQSVGESTGFTTQCILAVPVIFEGPLLAVMEAVNKKNVQFGLHRNGSSTYATACFLCRHSHSKRRGFL